MGLQKFRTSCKEQIVLQRLIVFVEWESKFENEEEKIIVHGKGLHGLTAPTEILDVGNSGTTTRLISEFCWTTF